MSGSRRALLDALPEAALALGSSSMWLDLQGDAVASNLDSQALYQIARLATTNEAGSCRWLDSIYHPSRYAGEALSLSGNRFNDSSFLSNASSSWQAIDPKLLYLRTNQSSLLRPGDQAFSSLCVTKHNAALTDKQFVPLLTRPDGSLPLTRELLSNVLPVGVNYDTIMQIDLVRDVKMYQVSLAE
jgi:hypothetical protein